MFKRKIWFLKRVNCLKTPRERLFELKTNLTEICKRKFELKQASKVVTEVELEWYQDKLDCEIQILKVNVVIKLRVGNREETRIEMIFGSDISEWLYCG